MPSRPKTTPSSSAHIQALATQIEQSVQRSMSQRLDKISRDNESQIKKLLDDTLSQLSEQLLRLTTDAVSDSERANLKAVPGEAKLGNALGRLINRTISDALTREKTTVSATETDRSKQAGTLRASKSQQAAAVAAKAQKGTRNL